MPDPTAASVLDVGAADGVAVVQITTDTLDAATSGAVGRELAGCAERAGERRLSLDLGGVRFLTAAGLGMLVTFSRSVRAAGGQLSMSNARPLVYGVFEVCRLTKFFDVHKPAG